MDKSKLKKSLKNLILVLVPVLLLISIFAIVFNRVFYFSDFKNRVEVKASSQSNEEIENFLSNFAQNPNAAHIDNQNGSIYFQHLSVQDVENQVNAVKSEGITLEIKEVIVNNKFILENYSIFFILIFVVCSSLVFYIVLKNRGKITFPELLKFFLPYLFPYLVSAIIYLGILSLASRIYFITEHEFIALYFVNVLISVLFLLSVSDFDPKEDITSLIISRKIFAKINSYGLPLLIFSVTFIPALALSFGVKTIPILVSLLGSLLVLYLSIRWVYQILYLNFDLNNLNGKFRRKVIKKNTSKPESKDVKIKDKKKGRGKKRGRR